MAARTPTPPPRPSSRRAVGLALLALLVLGVGLAVLLGDLAGQGPVAADDDVAAVVARHREPWLTAAMRIATRLGSSWVLGPLVACVAVVLLARHRRADAVLLVAAAAGASALQVLVKVLVGRPRPVLDEVLATVSSSSFPSGHSTQAAAVWGALALLVSRSSVRPVRRAGVWAGAAVLVALVGLSRLYLGVHWLTDVLGGAVLGAGWLLLVATAVTVLRRTLVDPAARPSPADARTHPGP